MEFQGLIHQHVAYMLQFQNSAELPEELGILPHPLDTGETYAGSAFMAVIKNFSM